MTSCFVLCYVPPLRSMLTTGAVLVSRSATVRPFLMARNMLTASSDVFVYHHPTYCSSDEGPGVVSYPRLYDLPHLLPPYARVHSATKTVVSPGA